MIGLDGEVGSIAVGKRANLVFLDNEYMLKSVMLDGVTVK
jgi:N-acetylglucosamine-6-phosphate deacetylase